MIGKTTKLLLSFLILISYTEQKICAQTYTKTIVWKNNRQFVSQEQVKYLFDFENAVLLNSGLMPYYSENIRLNQYNSNYKYIVKLENKQFIALNTSEYSAVEDVEMIHDSIQINSNIVIDKGKAFLNLNFIPLQKLKTGSSIEKLINFDIVIYKVLKSSSKSNKLAVNSSVLSTGTWKKIRISKSGLYQLTFEEIQNMGFSNPQNIRIFGNDAGWLPMIAGNIRPDDLIENDILIQNNTVTFFAHGPDLWKYNEAKVLFEPSRHYYSEFAYYFLTTNYNSGYNNTIKSINSDSQIETHSVNTYQYHTVHDVDILNIAETGRRMYGESFDINNTQTFNFPIPNLVNNSNARIVVNAASTSGNSSFLVSVKGSTGTINFSEPNDYTFADRSSLDFIFNAGLTDDLNVNLIFSSASPSIQSWLDNIYINAKCDLKFAGGQMMFRNSDFISPTNVIKYTLSIAGNSVIVWDISDPTKPKKVNSDVFSNYQTFKFSGLEIKEFIAFNNTNFLKPDLENVKDVSNQNLHATPANTEMIIVTHPDFYTQANELKVLHETIDNMKIQLVTSEQVHNEFSCGAPDFSAIRDYARLVYQKATTDTLKYLLLFGDGSYDNRSGEGINGNYVLTYQQDNSESIGYSYVTDDYFGILDDSEGDLGTGLSGLLDIGVGRIPVSSVQEAKEHIAKIKNYVNTTTFGDWRNKLCFIADDEDNNVHMRDADELTSLVDLNHPYFNIEKIYFDAYTQYTESGGERYPNVNEAINNRVQKGALLINYTGHGGEQGLGHERVVTISEIESWKNFDKLALFVTATCEFTRFDDFKFKSAGERVILNPNGGAIAMFTTARIAYIHSNFLLSKEFYKHIFEREIAGKQLRLGDVIRLTKNKLTGNNKLIFFLMGDPALKLGYADDNHIITKTINNKPIGDIDTLKALSEATFKGEIQNKFGIKLNSFNGYVYPTVYDKKVVINTLDNDGFGPFTYSDRSNIIYKGKASVKSGDFSFSFIVPKDIAMNVDTGKVSYYGDNGIVDAMGYAYDFLVGELSTDYPNDNIGPEIKLYMNDENFVSGGMTDGNPRIFAKLFDEHGINTASGGIGHDITGILDNDVQNIIIMNDDYRADADTYKSGSVEHFLFNLEPGEHNLKFKAWDVYNNSTEEILNFVVVESGNLTIDRLLNYPNPFTTHTDFYFEHNQIGTEIDVMIQIFTVSGKLIKTIQTFLIPDGYRAGPYPWNGTDDFGNRIGRGVYIYRVKLRSSLGDTVEKFEKLLILK